MLSIGLKCHKRIENNLAPLSILVSTLLSRNFFSLDCWTPWKDDGDLLIGTHFFFQLLQEGSLEKIIYKREKIKLLVP